MQERKNCGTPARKDGVEWEQHGCVINEGKGGIETFHHIPFIAPFELSELLHGYVRRKDHGGRCSSARVEASEVGDSARHFWMS